MRTGRTAGLLCGLLLVFVCSARATNLDWDDQGTYVVRASGTIVATGKLGTGTWVRISSNVDKDE